MKNYYNLCKILILKTGKYKFKSFHMLKLVWNCVSFTFSFRKNKGNNDDNSNETSEYTNTLFRKKRFEIIFFVQQNASKFAIFKKENLCSFFRFSFSSFLSFPL